MYLFFVNSIKKKGVTLHGRFNFFLINSVALFITITDLSK